VGIDSITHEVSRVWYGAEPVMDAAWLPDQAAVLVSHSGGLSVIEPTSTKEGALESFEIKLRSTSAEDQRLFIGLTPGPSGVVAAQVRELVPGRADVRPFLALIDAGLKVTIMPDLKLLPGALVWKAADVLVLHEAGEIVEWRSREQGVWDRGRVLARLGETDYFMGLAGDAIVTVRSRTLFINETPVCKVDNRVIYERKVLIRPTDVVALPAAGGILFVGHDGAVRREAALDERFSFGTLFPGTGEIVGIAGNAVASLREDPERIWLFPKTCTLTGE
jgi:hypothetical protein